MRIPIIGKRKKAKKKETHVFITRARRIAENHANGRAKQSIARKTGRSKR